MSESTELVVGASWPLYQLPLASTGYIKEWRGVDREVRETVRQREPPRELTRGGFSQKVPGVVRSLSENLGVGEDTVQGELATVAELEGELLASRPPCPRCSRIRRRQCQSSRPVCSCSW